MELGDFKVQFMHDAKRGTRCVLKDSETNEVLHEGWARKHPSDAFCKVIGRKYALTAALKTVDRYERHEVWAAYLIQCKI